MKESNLSPTASLVGGNGFTNRREGHHPLARNWHEWESNPQITKVFSDLSPFLPVLGADTDIRQTPLTLRMFARESLDCGGSSLVALFLTS